MAKRNYSKRGRNIEPSVQTLVFAVPSTVAGTSSYIDLSQVASLVNRRFYRQGINWAVAGFKFLGITGSGVIQVSKLPNTWMLSNAWTKSFKAWQKMNSEALAESESVRPKFLDFKIYADSGHHAAGYAANLLPQAGFNAVSPGNQYVPGEWEASKVVMPQIGGTTLSREIIAVGSSFPGPGASGFDAVSMIEGYAASRALPQPTEPATPADASDVTGLTPENWIAAIFDEGTNQTDAVLEDMITENNEAPYPFEGDGTHTDTMYPGGANNVPHLQTHDYEFVTGTTIGGTTRLKGGNFPCGLIKIDAQSVEDTTYQLVIDLIPGNHRGYLCEPMMEM